MPIFDNHKRTLVDTFYDTFMKFIKETDLGKADMESIAGDTYHNRFATDRKHNKGDKKFKPLKKRCVKCGTSSGQLDIDHKDGNRNNNNRSNLRYICRSCHRKMHAKRNGGKGSLEDSATIYSTAARIIDDPQTPESQAIANQHKNSDIMHVEFILCHEGINGNQDEFFSDDMEASASTAINKPVNWEHSDLNIGVIYESKFVPVKNLDEEAKAYFEDIDPLEKDFIVCKAIIWEYKHPREANIMRERHSNGSLRFSMENLFEKARCSECEEIFARKYEYCDHLLLRRQTKAVSRQFINSNYIGAGCIKNPADEGAKTLALAGLLTESAVFSKLINSKIMNNIDIESTIIPYIVKARDFKMEIEKKNDIPEEYRNDLSDLKDSAFADSINRLFPIHDAEHAEASADKILNNNLEFYNKQEKLILAENLAKALNSFDLEIIEYIDDNNEGGNQEMKIDTNSPEFKDALKEALAQELKAIESGEKIKDLESEIETAKASIQSLEEEKTLLTDAKAKAEKDLEDFKSQVEREKQATARFATLEEKGFKFEDNSEFVKNLVATASDEDFSKFVSTLEEVDKAAEAKFHTNDANMTDEEKKKKEEEEKKNKAKADVTDPVDESKDVAIASKIDDDSPSDEKSFIDDCLKETLDIIG